MFSCEKEDGVVANNIQEKGDYMMIIMTIIMQKE